MREIGVIAPHAAVAIPEKSRNTRAFILLVEITPAGSISPNQ